MLLRPLLQGEVRVSEWVSEWVSDWVIEYVSVCVCECECVWVCVCVSHYCNIHIIQQGYVYAQVAQHKDKVLLMCCWCVADEQTTNVLLMCC